MKTRLMIPALLAAATFSAGAYAHGNDRDWRDDRHRAQHHQVVRHAPPPQVVYVRPRINAPRVVQPARVVYRPAAVVYPPVPVVHYLPPPPPYPPLPSERTVGRTVGAVAGGVIGHQVGDGHLAPILIGAVLGGVIGDQIAR